MICHPLTALLLLKTTDFGPKTASIVVFRFVRQGSGVGTFRTTLSPIFAFFIASFHPLPDGANPQRRFGLGCLIKLSFNQIHHAVSVFPSSGTHGFSGFSVIVS